MCRSHKINCIAPTRNTTHTNLANDIYVTMRFVNETYFISEHFQTTHTSLVYIMASAALYFESSDEWIDLSLLSANRTCEWNWLRQWRWKHVVGRWKRSFSYSQSVALDLARNERKHILTVLEITPAVHKTETILDEIKNQSIKYIVMIKKLIIFQCDCINHTRNKINCITTLMVYLEYCSYSICLKIEINSFDIEI